MNRRVVVEFVNPAIPLRAFDYVATFEDFDLGDPCGYGSTPEEAMADFEASKHDAPPLFPPWEFFCTLGDELTAEQYERDAIAGAQSDEQLEW